MRDACAIAFVLIASQDGAAQGGSHHTRHFEYAVLHSFGSDDDAGPNGPLIQASDGNFYGSTAGGSFNIDGSVYRMTAQGVVANIFRFGSGVPYGALVEGADHNLYGTADWADGGFAFRLSRSGEFTLLHHFSGGPLDGARPRAGLILARDGNLYGTTDEGGRHDAGTVYRMTPSGDVTVLYSFNPDAVKGFNGWYPHAPLVQGVDGGLYGTTENTGACNSTCGGVFKLSMEGALIWGRVLTTRQGVNPNGPLVEASDGNLYGTAILGGVIECDGQGCGTAFRVTPDGEIADIHRFRATEGPCPSTGLIQARDGALYGTTEGIFELKGRIFRLSLRGKLQTYHKFKGSPDGVWPNSLMQSADGTLLGTTSGGGRHSVGTIYRFLRSPLPSVPHRPE